LSSWKVPLAYINLRPDYDSIVNFWRVYGGHTEAAAEACEAFLSQVIDVKQFPPNQVKLHDGLGNRQGFGEQLPGR